MVAMKVAALVHFSMPWRCAGSETVLHELMKACVTAGHDVTVWVTHKDSHKTWTGREPDTEFDGVKIVRCANELVAGGQLRRWNPDVVVSHHQHTMHAMRVAKQVNARSVFLTHNDYDLNRRPLRTQPDLVVFNTDHVQDTLTRKFGAPKQSMTFHPPLTPDRHIAGDIGDSITLVNLNADKGAHLFYDLARTQPDRKFLGVIGAHGQQIVKRNLPNVTIMEHTPTMTDVWSKTRVLLMPSRYESYGLVAQEAGLNGIPTIAHPTTGLVENLGPEGMFADREQLGDWIDLLTALDDPERYDEASDYALDRAGEAVDATRRTLREWTRWVEGVL